MVAGATLYLFPLGENTLFTPFLSVAIMALPFDFGPIFFLTVVHIRWLMIAAGWKRRKKAEKVQILISKKHSFPGVKR